jgi:molecular chaperone IbpA
MRTAFDLTPFRQSTVGFDRLFDLLERGPRGESSEGYPPFDLVKEGEDTFRIDLAVAGYKPDDIEVVAQQNQLSVTGNRPESADKGEYVHRGIAMRSFERRFALADFVEVSSANFNNGLLSIRLRRVIPEAMRPQKIAVGVGGSQQIEHSPAKEQTEPA